MFWKVVKDGKVLDALEFLVYVTSHPYGGTVGVDSESKAAGIVSSDGNVIYHVDGWRDFNEPYETVELKSITEEEYLALKEALETEKEIDDTPSELQEITDDETFKYIKEMKIAQMSKLCNEIIVAGFDIELSDGEMHHFDLTTEDQINFVSLKDMIDKGAAVAPYHASDELCVFFSAEDIYKIVQVGGDFKTYHVTYFNSLKDYIKSMTTLEELKTVQYGMEIPVEHQSEVLQYLMSQQNT